MDCELTVLIPIYNPGRYLKEALDSVFTQAYQDWRVILVDDASTDDSLTIVSEYLGDPRVTLIRNLQNVGQANTLNNGLAIVETPFLIQLDGDDWFFNDTLQTMMEVARNQSENVAVFYGNYLTIYQNKDGKTLKEVIVKGRNFKDRYDFLLSNRTVRPRCYRTSALKAVGGWPTGGPFEDRYSEDKRMLFRLIEDYRFCWIDKLLYNYRKHNGNLTNNRKENSQMIDWNIRTTLKRWGNLYQPVFKTYKDGWKKVVRLKPTKHP